MEKTPMHLEWDIELPANTTGEVHLPDGRKEKIGSGKYHFSVDIPTRNAAIISDEFLYEKASFPECHGATIVELKNGDLVASSSVEPKNVIRIAASGFAASPKVPKNGRLPSWLPTEFFHSKIRRLL